METKGKEAVSQESWDNIHDELCADWLECSEAPFETSLAKLDSSLRGGFVYHF